jgi:FkbM family methyltransferase
VELATIEPLAPSQDQLDRKRVIEAESDVGAIWLERDAELLTPAVLEYGCWAPDITRLMRRILRPGMTFVDAGANIGYFSVLASMLVGPSGRVFCVEVDPSNIAILRANLWRNGCTNAKVLPVAAWSEQTELNLRTIPEGGAGSSVGQQPRDQDLHVSALPIQDLVDGRVDYMKVDCESTDHMVVMGAADLFRRNPKMIATVEFNPAHVTHTGHTPQQILDIYRELRLRPFEVTLHGRLTPTSYERLAASAKPGEQVIFDFALSPTRPVRLVATHYIDTWFPWGLWHRMLRFGGDMLEYVPERIRPKIRRRDRIVRGERR